MARIFISYKRTDKEKVFPLKDRIEAAIGEPCWIDLEGIKSDAFFVNVIINAIKQAEVFLFMYSSTHSTITDFENDWTVKEINFAQKQKKRIVFVNLDNTPLSDYFEMLFGLKQQVDALSPSSFNQLIQDLKIWLPAPKSDLDITKAPSHKESQNERDIIESYENGKKLYYSQQYKKALETLRFAAENGHADAQYFSGLINFLAYCGIKNYEAAKYWFEKSAEQGHKYGEDHLAMMYKNGWGVDRDISKALYWYKKSAEQQNPDAYFSIGSLYEEGDDIEQNDELAFENYLKAASIGSSGHSSTPKAMIKVAQMYEYGLGIEQSHSQAIKWYKKYLIFLEKDNAPGNDREKEQILDKIKALEN